MRLRTMFVICISSVPFFALPAAAKGNPEAGQKLYAEACRSCHGAKGQGNPAMYKRVKAKVVHLGSEGAQKKTDDFIRKTITEGWQKMDKVEDITTPQQVEDVLAFIRTLRLPPPNAAK